MKHPNLSVIALALVISACGSGGKSDGSTPPPTTTLQVCESMGGAGVTVSETARCTGCSSTDVAKAADEDVASNSVVVAAFSLGGQPISIRATNPARRFTAGKKAGVYLTYPSGSGGSASVTSLTTTVATYLDGGLQESASASSSSSTLTRQQVQTGASDYPETFAYFTTTKPFDAVEVRISNAGTSNASLKIYELCGNGSP